MPKRRGHGEGAVFQRGDGRWVAVARLRDGSRRWLYGRSRAEVIGRLAEFRRSGRAPTHWTVGAWLTDWLESTRSRVRASTWIHYEQNVRLHLAPLRAIRLESLTSGDVRRLREQLTRSGLAPRTVGHALTILRMALRAAVRDELLVRNAAEWVDGPRVPRVELPILSLVDARRLIAVAADHPLGPLWTLLVGTGLRLGEALALRWVDVDLATRTLTVSGSLTYVSGRLRPPGTPSAVRLEPKTEAGRRTIALPAFVASALATQRDRQAVTSIYVLANRHGRPFDRRYVQRTFASFLAESGLPRVTVHALRHTAASLMIAGGLSLDDVKRVLGHANISLTSDTYGHLYEHRSREVAAQLDRIIGREA